MVLRSFDQLLAERKPSKGKAKRLAVAAAHDSHTLEAVMKARDDGIIEPILIGRGEEIRRILDSTGVSINVPVVIHEEDDDRAAAKAVSLVRCGEADLLMKGKLNTANMLRAVIDKNTGLLEEGRVISLMAMAQIPGYHKLLVMTDGGIVRDPDLGQKKCIIENAVGVLKNLGYECPKVAVMAAVEKVNEKMPETVDADALVQMNRSGELKDCIVEGPLSMDIALDAEMARIKNYQGKIAGDPDILVWPNVVAGNLVGKALVRFGGAKTISFAVGAKCPLVVTSRAASASIKYLTILAAAGAVFD